MSSRVVACRLRHDIPSSEPAAHTGCNDWEPPAPKEREPGGAAEVLLAVERRGVVESQGPKKGAPGA